MAKPKKGSAARDGPKKVWKSPVKVSIGKKALPKAQPKIVFGHAHNPRESREYLVPEPKVGIRSLGLEHLEPLALVDEISQGLQFGQFKVLQKETGVSKEKILRAAHISARTLDRRQREGRFDPLESERLARFGRLFDHAVELFDGDRDAARRWLDEPKAALGGRSPFELSLSEPGAREVEQLIARLEHGVFS